MSSNSNSNKLSTFEVISYGLTSATCLGNLLCVTYLSTFWTDVLGISAAAVATMLLLSRILDGISDVIMGNIIDKTHTKYGQAKPWLLIGAVGGGIMSILLFSVPNMSQTGKIIVSFILYMILTVVFATMSAIACSALNNLISPDQNQRIRLGSVYFVFYFALTIAISFGLMFIEPLGGGQLAWVKLCIIATVLSLIILSIAWKGIKERVVHEKPKSENEKIKFKDVMFALTHNKYYFCTMGIYLCINIYNAMVIGVGVYFALHIMNSMEAFTILMVASYVPTIIGTMITPALSRFIGSRKVILIGNILTIAGYLLMAVQPRNLVWVAIFIGIGGFGSGAISANINPFCAMSADYGEYKLGKAMPGVYSGAASFGTKVGSAIGGALYGFILAAAGYDGMAEVQTAAAQNAIIGCYCLAPAILTIVILVLSIPMGTLEKNYPRISEELQERRLQAEQN